MKTLYIIRHAKSSWDDSQLHDIERPLADRGKKDAVVMGKFLLKKNAFPQVVMSSPALRAIATSRIICDEVGYDKNKIKIQNELYFGDQEGIIKMLQTIGSKPDRVFIFGHNPTFTNLANALCPSFTEEMPTCSIVSLQFKIDSWQLVEPGAGKLVSFDTPKQHR